MGGGAIQEEATGHVPSTAESRMSERAAEGISFRTARRVQRAREGNCVCERAHVCGRGESESGCVCERAHVCV
jgi:hypothetical protein